MNKKTNITESGLNSYNRRQFLKTSSLAGLIVSLSGLGISSAVAMPSKPFQRSPLGSGLNIFSISVIDDATSLALHSDKINPIIKRCLTSDFELPKPGSNDPQPGNTARLASVLKFNKEDFVSLMVNAREKKDELDDFGEETQKLGFALGWVASHAGSLYLKDFINKGDQLFSESSIYCDAEILRSKSADKTKSVNAEDMRSLFHQMMPRIFTRFHTFIPDDDGPEWVLRMAEWRENWNNYFNELAVAYATPDPDKIRKYVTGPGFYDPDDQVIAMVRSFTTNSADIAGEIRQSVESDATSQYAKAITEGYQYIKTARDFFDGKIDEKELAETIKA